MRTRPAYVRQLAAELEMLAHGSSTSWNPAGGNSVPDSRPPSGDSNPPHLMFLAEWDKRGDGVLQKWLEELQRWKGGYRTRREPESTEDDWIIDDGVGQSPDLVAQRFRCTPTRVRKLRLARGLSAETGIRVDVKGLTQREAADELGVSQPTVSRMRKRAA